MMGIIELVNADNDFDIFINKILWIDGMIERI